MAHIEKIKGARGVSYRFIVSGGVDCNGKRIVHRKTWKPPVGMTEKQAEKAANREAVLYEQSILQGYSLDNRQTFAQYADYVLDLKGRTGAKAKTLDRYRELLIRTNEAIGHLKLADIRPQHLNAFYKSLAEPGIRAGSGSAVTKIDLAQWLKANKKTRAGIGEAAGVAASTVSAAAAGKPIQEKTADAIAAAMGMKTAEVFTITANTEPLSEKTVLAYHRLISIILAQAEMEMLVPYNAAAKATPPKANKKSPTYFQPETVSDILEALEQEPLKWRLITHLMIVTGCRRGEIMGLKWQKVDFEASRITIDTALVVSPSKGVYETSTKTGNTRYLVLPAETMHLLKEHKKAQLALQLANGDRWMHTGYVFTQDNGDSMHPDSVTAWLSEFSRRHGLPHIHPHAFRHTVASVLLGSGTDVVTVAAQLGHANATTTETVYAHIIEENKAKATECIADVLLRKKA